MEQTLIKIICFYYFYIILVLFYMFFKRKAAIRSKDISIKHFKAYQGETTTELQTIQNHFNNQFQVPILFFIACLISLQQNTVSSFTIGFAALFIMSRIAHSFIHLGSNNVIFRAFAYFLGIISIGLIFVSNLI